MTESVTILDNMLTMEDLAKAFGCTVLTIKNWRGKKGLPYIRIRGSGRDSIRFKKSEVEEWAIKNGMAVGYPVTIRQMVGRHRTQNSRANEEE